MQWRMIPRFHRAAVTKADQTRTSSLGAARPLPPSADIGPGGQSVGQAAQFCLAHEHRNLGGAQRAAPGRSARRAGPHDRVR
jgi:hypothetical protein